MPDAIATQPLLVRDLGRLAYAPALEVQRRTHQAVLEASAAPTLLLVEHEPVITVSQRKGAAHHLLATPQRLAALGIDTAETDRGGDVTYHGPGQLVAYPILRLASLGLNVSGYMRWLEQIVLDAIAGFGVRGRREAGATGVWVDAAKLCAFGVRVRRNVTMHGLALNVTTNLAHFATIVPCGLAGRTVTSLHELLGAACPAMDAVKRELIAQFDRHYGASCSRS